MGRERAFPDWDVVNRLFYETLGEQNFHLDDEDERHWPTVDYVKWNDYGYSQYLKKLAKDETTFTDQACSWTQDETYAACFPNGIGADGRISAIEEEEAYKRLSKHCWELLKTAPDGYVQGRLESDKRAELHRFVVCEHRAFRSLQGSTRPVPIRFITNVSSLLLTYAGEKPSQRFKGQAEALELKLAMVARRQPELALAMAKMVAPHVAEAMKILIHADPRRLAELQAASPARTALGNGGASSAEEPTDQAASV